MRLPSPQRASAPKSDRATAGILSNCEGADRLLILVRSQLGDFDSLEYAWWLLRVAETLQSMGITIRAVGIGDRNSGLKFCDYTGFPLEWLFVDPHGRTAPTIRTLSRVIVKITRFIDRAKCLAQLNVKVCRDRQSRDFGMFRGYRGDRLAPQLIDEQETIKAAPLPALKGSFFNLAGGTGFQRPFELATLRLRNMTEVVGIVRSGTYRLTLTGQMPNARHHEAVEETDISINDIGLGHGSPRMICNSASVRP